MKWKLKLKTVSNMVMSIIKSRNINCKTFLKGKLIAYLVFSVMIVTFIYCMIPIFNSWPDGAGEIHTNYVGTITVAERGSMVVEQGDILIAQKEFPENMGNSSLENVSLTRFNGQYILHYFPTYSAIVIPFKSICSFLGLPLYKAFRLANLTMYLLVLFSVFFFLKASYVTRLSIVFLLACSPTVIYLWWISSEVCIFTFISLSVLFYYNKSYKLSAFFIAVASTMNITVSLFGFLIIANYFVDVYKASKHLKLLDIIKGNIKQTILLATSFLPVFFTPLASYYIFGKFFPATSIATSAYLFKRMYAYLFDLNFGYLPYFPILLPLVFVIVIVAIYKKKYVVVLQFCAFMLVVLMYSATYHINCGLDGIHRYNSFTLPLLVFFVAMNYQLIISKRYIYIGIVLSSAIPLIFLSHERYVARIWFNLNSVATYILDNMPSLYNPLYSTFISRVTRVDGGYQYTQPVVYFDSVGYATKVLLTRDSADVLLQLVTGDSNSISYLKTKIDDIKKRKDNDFVYINFSPLSRVFLKKRVYIEKIIDRPLSILKPGLQYSPNSSFEFSEFSEDENGRRWTKNKKAAIQFGIDTLDNFTGILALDFATLGNQNIKILLNNKEIAFFDELSFNGLKEIKFDSKLLRNGNNVLEFDLPDARLPGNGDTRTLAISLKSFELR